MKNYTLIFTVILLTGTLILSFFIDNQDLITSLWIFGILTILFSNNINKIISKINGKN